MTDLWSRHQEGYFPNEIRHTSKVSRCWWLSAWHGILSFNNLKSYTETKRNEVLKAGYVTCIIFERISKCIWSTMWGHTLTHQWLMYDCFPHSQPFMEKYLKIQDTCGVHNLHALPGMLGGFIGAIVAAAATEEVYSREGWVTGTHRHAQITRHLCWLKPLTDAETHTQISGIVFSWSSRLSTDLQDNKVYFSLQVDRDVWLWRRICRQNGRNPGRLPGGRRLCGYCIRSRWWSGCWWVYKMCWLC